MKVRKLVLCILLSLALVVTFIPVISYADYETEGFADVEEMIDEGVQIPAISAGQTKTVTNEGVFVFKPTVSGTYVFYSYNTGDSNADPIGRVLCDDEDGLEEISRSDDYYQTDGSADFRAYFNAVAGETYYLQAANYYKDAVFGVALEENIAETAVTFTPGGEHYATVPCSASAGDYSYWNPPYFGPGDKITVKYANNTTKEYVYKAIADAWDPNYSDGAFVNVANEKEVLPAEVGLYLDESLPTATYKAGETKAFPMEFYYNSYNFDFQTVTTINVKFTFSHSMKRTAPVPETCSTAGNIEYWYCSNCKKYFSDWFGQNEIAEGAWVVPAGHKWAYAVKDAAGLLKNGTGCDRCTVCGIEQNYVVLPGWAKYYVKKLKVAKGSKSFTVKWKKQSKKNLKKFNGYQIRYSTKANMSGAKMTTAKKTATSKTIKKLKKKTKYYVQVRTFTKKGGVTYYSKWSAKKTVKTK